MKKTEIVYFLNKYQNKTIVMPCHTVHDIQLVDEQTD